MAIRRPRHPPSGAACTPPAVEPRLDRHHASCRMRLSALCVWRLAARLWQNSRQHMRADRACLRVRPASGEIVGYLRALWLVRPPRRRARAPRRCTLAGGVWRSARAGQWWNSRVGAPVDTAGCGWRGGSTCGVVWAMRWRSRKGRRRSGGCGVVVVRWPTGKATWPPLPHLLCPLFPFFLLSLPSLCCRPPPSATLRSIRIFLRISLFPRSQPLPTCVLSSCKRSAARVLWWRAFSAVHNCSYLFDLDLPRSPVRLCCSRHFSCSTFLLQALSLDLDPELSLFCLPLLSFHFYLSTFRFRLFSFDFYLSTFIFRLLSFHFYLSTFLLPSSPLVSLLDLFTLSNIHALISLFSLLFRLGQRRSNDIWRIWRGRSRCAAPLVHESNLFCRGTRVRCDRGAG